MHLNGRPYTFSRWREREQRASALQDARSYPPLSALHNAMPATMLMQMPLGLVMRMLMLTLLDHRTLIRFPVLDALGILVRLLGTQRHGQGGLIITPLRRADILGKRVGIVLVAIAVAGGTGRAGTIGEGLLVAGLGLEHDTVGAEDGAVDVGDVVEEHGVFLEGHVGVEGDGVFELGDVAGEGAFEGELDAVAVALLEELREVLFVRLAVLDGGDDGLAVEGVAGGAPVDGNAAVVDHDGFAAVVDVGFAGESGGREGEGREGGEGGEVHFELFGRADDAIRR